MNIYVGNLPQEATEEGLRELFASKGDVKTVKIIMDHATGQPRGFAFVEMFTKNDGVKAISSLNGVEFLGNQLKVNEAKPRTNDRPRRF
ncbi:MAG: RNA-binding protein [Spirochaetes bacterium GWF1_41_5]|nr:MAG: RNA-binding protein [Spirochaetes bacterium GWF1_41_5]